MSCYAEIGTFYSGYGAFIRFMFDDTSLCFGNVNVNETMATEIISDMMDAAFKQDRDMRYQKYEVKNHDIQIFNGLLGD